MNVRHRLSAWTHWLGRIGVLLLLAAGVTVSLLWLAGKFEPKVPANSPSSAAHTVTGEEYAERVVPVRSISLPLTETAVGTIRAVHETTVGSKLLARVVEVNLKAGHKALQRFSAGWQSIAQKPKPSGEPVIPVSLVRRLCKHGIACEKICNNVSGTSHLSQTLS